MVTMSPPRPFLSLLVVFTMAFGLAAGLGPATGAQEAPAGDNVVVVADPVGDVASLGTSTGGGPAPALFDHIDIESFTFGPETVDSFSLGITFVGWDPTLSRAIETAALDKLGCRIQWSYNGNEDLRYTLWIDADYLVPDEEGPSFWSELQFYHHSESGSQWDWTSNGYTMVYEVDTSTLRFTFPKALVPVFPGGHPAMAGDQLELRRAYCDTDTAIVPHRDHLNEEDARYAFRSAGAGEVVKVSVGTDPAHATVTDPTRWEFPRDGLTTKTTTVQPEEQSLVPVRLENLAAERKLVLLSAEAATADWNLSIAPSIFLKPKESRVVNLIVTPPAGAELGSTVDAEVKAEVAAEDSVGTASLRLKVSPQLGEGYNKIHFHAKEVDQGRYQDIADAVGVREYELLASLLPEAAGYDVTTMDPGPFNSRWEYASLDPSSRPVTLLAEENAVFQVTVVGDEGAQHRVSIWVSSSETDFYYYSSRLSVGTHTIDVFPRFDEDLDLPPGTQISVGLYGGRGMDLAASGIDLSATHLALPVQTSKSGLNVTDGRFLPNLALAPGEEKTTYVNPGKEYAFDLNLSNDGIEEDELQVTAITNATGWTVKVQPGARFRVAAGDATPLSVSVIAPEDAKEGDAAEIEVKATSKNDPGASATLTLRSIATAGVELEEKPYAEKEGQIAPLTDEEASPAPHALLAALALLGVITALRRRS